jgi:hypothetical protein
MDKGQVKNIVFLCKAQSSKPYSVELEGILLDTMKKFSYIKNQKLKSL